MLGIIVDPPTSKDPNKESSPNEKDDNLDFVLSNSDEEAGNLSGSEGEMNRALEKSIC